MQPKSAVMLRVLLNKYCKGTPESFLSCLPNEETQQVLATDIRSEDPSPVFKTPFEKIEAIHPSWFAPILSKLPTEAQSLLLHSLPEGHALRLGRTLKTRMEVGRLSEPIKFFLAGKLYQTLVGESEPLPKAFLPPVNLEPLIDLKKDELVELVEFLGLHDLGENLRQILNQKILQRVYACLSPREQQYLKFCLQQKEKVAAPPLGLERWSGDCEKLKNTLQTRGIIRLGKALSGVHPDFAHHIAYTFDAGRGQTLLRYRSPNPQPGITPALAQQVLSLLNILKKKSAA